MPSPYEFAIVSTGAGNRKDWLDLARASEDLGYSALYITDHVQQELAPLPALAAAAQVTSSLRMGTYVLGQGLRNPVMLLRELTTLDVLTDGRIDIGLGAGWLAADFAQTGVVMEPGGMRLERLAALVSLIKRAWGGGLCDFSDGVLDAKVGEQPIPGLQRPHPPLMIAGGSPGTLRLAAREADIVSLSPRAVAGGLDESDARAASIDEKVAIVRSAAGHRLDRLRLNLLVWECLVLNKPDKILAIFARSIGCPVEEVQKIPSLLIGSTVQIIDLLEERRARWGISVITIPASAMKPFAPVVAALAAPLVKA